jgi:hypothetical protein
VAKRTRVTRTAQRPGARPATVKGATAPTRREPVATSAALAPAQPLSSVGDAVALVEAQSGSTATAGSGAISRSMPGRVKVKPNSLLAARAETEYVYVGKDLRRIVMVGASLFGVLILLWILLVVFGLSGLYG